MRVLHISTRLILGGSQENTVLSCEGQAERGYEVHLAFGPIFGPEGSMLDRVEAFRTSNGQTIRTHELPNLVREVDPRKDHRCWSRDLRRLLQETRPDVVHTHSSKAGVLGRWAAWLTRDEGRPRPAVVHTIHGPPFMPVEGPPHARVATRLKNGLYAAAERFAALRCDVIVAVADAMTEQFLARRIGEPDKYVTVRSGMETRRFVEAPPGETRDDARRELGLGPEHFVVGTVARLAQHKGHDDLIDALADDLRAHEYWRLLWVGDGWWRDRLVDRLAREGLRDRVVLAGLVPPERVPMMVRAMDVLAHPSAREGLPRTVPQALLCGVPAVAYDVDGTREACLDVDASGDRATGILVRPGDTRGLRAAVGRLAGDPDLRRRLGEAGRVFAESEFAAEWMVDQLDEVYALAIERRNATDARS
ncbi:MAG: glycosyltransferase [Planctomycetota bacterium]